MEPKTPLVLLPATMKHGKILAKNMRKEDVEEIKASGGFNPKQAIKKALQDSHIAYTLWIHGEMTCMFGVVKATSEIEGDFGIPWLLTTNTVNKYPRIFWDASKRTVKRMLDDYGMLSNLVDSRYEAAIRWLKHLKFEFVENKFINPDGIPFHQIILKRTPHV